MGATAETSFSTNPDVCHCDLLFDTMMISSCLVNRFRDVFHYKIQVDFVSLKYKSLLEDTSRRVKTQRSQ